MPIQHQLKTVLTCPTRQTLWRKNIPTYRLMSSAILLVSFGNTSERRQGNERNPKDPENFQEQADYRRGGRASEAGIWECETGLFDPFLLLGRFSFGRSSILSGRLSLACPHRGIETIHLRAGRNVEHGDSMGHQGTIGPGDVQWMTAGKRIIHQEMPKGDELNRRVRLPALAKPAGVSQDRWTLDTRG